MSIIEKTVEKKLDGDTAELILNNAPPSQKMSAYIKSKEVSGYVPQCIYEGMLVLINRNTIRFLVLSKKGNKFESSHNIFVIKQNKKVKVRSVTFKDTIKRCFSHENSLIILGEDDKIINIVSKILAESANVDQEYHFLNPKIPTDTYNTLQASKSELSFKKQVGLGFHVYYYKYLPAENRTKKEVVEYLSSDPFVQGKSFSKILNNDDALLSVIYNAGDEIIELGLKSLSRVDNGIFTESAKIKISLLNDNSYTFYKVVLKDVLFRKIEETYFATLQFQTDDKKILKVLTLNLNQIVDQDSDNINTITLYDLDYFKKFGTEFKVENNNLTMKTIDDGHHLVYSEYVTTSFLGLFYSAPELKYADMNGALLKIKNKMFWVNRKKATEINFEQNEVKTFGHNNLCVYKGEELFLIKPRKGLLSQMFENIAESETKNFFNN